MSLVMAASDGTFHKAAVDWLAIAPMLVVAAGALIGVLVEAFVPRASRYWTGLLVAVATILAALATLVVGAYGLDGEGSDKHVVATLDRQVIMDRPAYLLQAVLLGLGLIALLLVAERFAGPQADAFTQSGAAAPRSADEEEAVRLGGTTTEIFPLFLFALFGMMIFPASGSLITMFVALEVLSLPLYVLTGLARRRRLLSQEAALKYFLLGSFSSAFFLFGMSLVFGATGTVDLGGIRAAAGLSMGLDGLLLPGLLLILVGVLFKVGAVPFHAWTPDVYQGAPTPVTGFMAACTKVAAFGALLRLLYVAFEGMAPHWRPVLAGIAVLTMLVGAVLTVVQTDIKRLLAYSSIAHAGFILVGVVALSARGVAGTIFYVTAYGFMTLAAFGLIMLVRHRGTEGTDLRHWAGLGRRAPLMGITMTFLMLAFTGIPLTSGFTAKFAAFSPAVAAGKGYGWLAIVGIVCSVITAFAYFKVVSTMFFGDGDGETTVASPSALTTFAVGIGVLMTLVLGVAPGLLLEVADRAARFIP